jgi:hypothetical protein
LPLYPGESQEKLRRYFTEQKNLPAGMHIIDSTKREKATPRPMPPPHLMQLSER